MIVPWLQGAPFRVSIGLDLRFLVAYKASVIVVMNVFEIAAVSIVKL